ncbi:HesA/MoeB/ThiF family protein [Shimia sp.]|uniref:HesA/MoeB/ThiF family protein n=1 Tax=Shimia sp. TaxID=1954381 RepID=UPI003296998D
MNRYARQMILPEVGTEGQARLARAHVLVVGAGGLGSPVLQYLAGAGVGVVTLIDPDHVEESNLHRQPLYRMSDLGQAKVHAARAHLLASNPEVRIEAHHLSLHPGNASTFVAQADVVIDAADSFAVSYILSDTCQAHRKPLIAASALGQTGYAGGFCGPVGAPSLRAVFPDLPDRGETCASAGVLGPVVGMIGALQAQMALQVVLQHDPSPLGQMITLDLQHLRFGGFAFLGAPEPPNAISFLEKADLSTEDHVIELRDTSEAPNPVVPYAKRLTRREARDVTIESDKRVVLCCSTGLRAWRAATELRSKGHETLAILAASACA